MQEKVDALNVKFNNAKLEVVAVLLDVEVIQMTLTSAKSSLEKGMMTWSNVKSKIWKLA